MISTMNFGCGVNNRCVATCALLAGFIVEPLLALRVKPGAETVIAGSVDYVTKLTYEFANKDQNGAIFWQMYTRFYWEMDKSYRPSSMTLWRDGELFTSQTNTPMCPDGFYHQPFASGDTGVGFDRYEDNYACPGMSVFSSTDHTFQLVIDGMPSVAYFAITLVYMGNDGSMVQYMAHPGDATDALVNQQVTTANGWEFYLEEPASGQLLQNPFQAGNPSITAYTGQTTPASDAIADYTYSVASGSSYSTQEVSLYRMPPWLVDSTSMADAGTDGNVLTYLIGGAVADAAPLYNSNVHYDGDTAFFSGAEYGFIKIQIPRTFDPSVEQTYAGKISEVGSETGYAMDYYSVSAANNGKPAIEVDQYGVNSMQMRALAGDDADFAYVIFAPAEVVHSAPTALLTRSGARVLTIPTTTGAFVFRMKNPDPQAMPWNLGMYDDLCPMCEDDNLSDTCWDLMRDSYQIDAAVGAGANIYIVSDDSGEAMTLDKVLDAVDQQLV